MNKNNNAKVVFLSSLVAILLMPFFLGQMVWADTPVDTPLGPVEIVSAWSQKCMDVTGVSQANGTPIQQYQCLGASQLNQIWQFVPVGGGYYQIVSMNSPSGTSMCLDVRGGVAALGNGIPLQQWQCLGTSQPNQLWNFVSLQQPAKVSCQFLTCSGYGVQSACMNPSCAGAPCEMGTMQITNGMGCSGQPQFDCSANRATGNICQ